MKKSFIRNTFIAVLLISNGIFIYNWLMGPHRPHGPRNEIIEKLHFDEKQVAQYEKLIHEHRTAINAAEQKLMKQKQRLYADLDEPFSDSILGDILITQAEIEHIHFNHFKAIEELCRPDQKVYFKSLNKEIASLFGPHKREKKK